MILAGIAALAAALGLGLVWWRLGGFTPDMRLHRLAPDVYVYRGFFSNSAVFVMPSSVVVIDTQTTPEAGARLRRLIAEVTPKPVRTVINTHYHGDHVGGNAAFPEAEVIAPKLTARFVAERDGERLEYCETFGLSVQEVPPVRPPDRGFEGRLELDVDGETLVLAQLGRVETPDAAVVWWPSRRALAAGDGVATDQYPWLGVPFLDEGLQDDGEWLAYLDAIDALGPRVLIPGHGAPLVGAARIRRRLRLLRRLLTDLLESVRAEIERATPFPELVERVDAALAHYRRRSDLRERVVSQRFAIYRAYNSVHPDRRGQGWWRDLRPSVLDRPDPGWQEHKARAASSPEQAARWAELAWYELERAFATRPIVDGTEWMRVAAISTGQALGLDPADPTALLCRGVIDVWGALVTSQPMDGPLNTLEAALRSDALTGRQRRVALFFLAKAHQAAGRDAECARHFRSLLPWPLRIAAPLLVPRMRTLP